MTRHLVSLRSTLLGQKQTVCRVRRPDGSLFFVKIYLIPITHQLDLVLNFALLTYHLTSGVVPWAIAYIFKLRARCRNLYRMARCLADFSGFILDMRGRFWMMINELTTTPVRLTPRQLRGNESSFSSSYTVFILQVTLGLVDRTLSTHSRFNPTKDDTR